MNKVLCLSLVLLSTLPFSVSAAENYFVEPMICKGQWNKRPPKYHPSYAQAAMKVISFWSVRASDCSLAPSSSTEVDYAPIGEKLEIRPDIELGHWFAGPLKVDGATVSAPFGVWAGEMQLQIIESRNVNGVRKDTLQGRYLLFDDYYYDMNCKATVVQNPSHVENATKDCK